jgi:PleD family two-component response regulator
MEDRMKGETNPIYNGDILVVDDKRDNLRLLTKLFVEHGFYARPVSNGQKAILAAQDQLPDLILLDIMMPDMDGYAVCEVLKADERTRDIPVIFISALNETVDKVKAFSIGGVDYITKPFQAEEILARVKTHLTLRSMKKSLVVKNAQLQKALDEIKSLRGILPLCSFCKKIRDDKGYWEQVDVYIYKYSEADISHSICPDCMKEHYPDLDISN